MKDVGVNPFEVIKNTRQLLEGTDTEIIIGSIRSVRQAGEALASGAHIVTITPRVLETMLTDEMTSKTVNEFDGAWEEMKRR